MFDRPEKSFCSLSRNSVAHIWYKAKQVRNLHISIIREVCTSYFAKYSPKDRLLLFVQPKVIRLLEILRNFNPKRSSDESQKYSLKIFLHKYTI